MIKHINILTIICSMLYTIDNAIAALSQTQRKYIIIFII